MCVSDKKGRSATVLMEIGLHASDVAKRLATEGNEIFRIRKKKNALPSFQSKLMRILMMRVLLNFI